MFILTNECLFVQTTFLHLGTKWVLSVHSFKKGVLMLGRISLIVTVLGAIPYIVSIFRTDVRPERTTWGIWTVVLVLAVISYRAAGAGDSIWFLVGDLFITGVIFVISLFRGVGGWSKVDIASITVALMGLVIWQTSHSPVWQMIGTLTADMVAIVPTLKKSLEDPMNDSPVIFATGSIAALLGVFSVGEWNIILLFYPAHLYTANFLTAVVIGTGRYYAKRTLIKGVI